MTARVERVSSDTPSSFSSAARARDADGCGTASSRAASEMLPVRATRTNRRRENRLSLMRIVSTMLIMNKSKSDYAPIQSIPHKRSLLLKPTLRRLRHKEQQHVESIENSRNPRRQTG